MRDETRTCCYDTQCSTPGRKKGAEGNGVESTSSSDTNQAHKGFSSTARDTENAAPCHPNVCFTKGAYVASFG